MAIRVHPPRHLEFAGFNPTEYPGLNGKHPLIASKAQIERSILMVGYHTARDSLAAGGPWRATLLGALVEGYLEPNLATTRYFRALEPSERVSMTFLMARAFTHWAADAFMSVPVLVHYYGSAITHTLATTASSLKAGAGQPKDRSRPDFFGLAPGEFHVFESKGRSLPTGAKNAPSSMANALLPAALAQVSRIATVNGAIPKTRTAAAWIFREGSSRGFVHDPPATADAYDTKIDVAEGLLNYYQLVRDCLSRSIAFKGVNFLRCRLDDRRTLFIDRELKQVLDALERKDLTGEEFLQHLESRRRSYERIRARIKGSSSIAMGLDGVGLVVSNGAALWR